MELIGDTGGQLLNDNWEYVRTVQTNQGNIIACIEQSCYRNSWISKKRS